MFKSNDWRKSSWSMTAAIILTWSSVWIPACLATTNVDRDLEDRAKTSFASGVELRVLPIGDSITNGTHWSSDAGGYRSRLYKAMTDQWTNAIHFVGAEHNGNFSQNHHEGHSSFFIKNISDASQFGIYQAPNIVLLHAGTNDVDRGSASEAPGNLINLIQHIFDVSANATIFVCKLIPSKKSGTEARIETFNKQVSSVVQPRFQGKKLVVVDMWTGFNTSNLQDDLHPNDAGYLDMANRFLKAIQSNEKLIVKPGTARNPPS